MAVMSALRIVFAAIGARAVTGSLPSDLRGAVKNGTQAERLDEASGAADPRNSVQNESDVRGTSLAASAGLEAEAASSGRPRCWLKPWNCRCAYLGCGGYRPHLACQCNPGCVAHKDCCRDYWGKCKAWPAAAPAPAPASAPAPPSPPVSKVMTLYHQTSPVIAALILKGGFKLGTSGWCGGGIYFAISPEDTSKKAISPDSHKGFIIAAQVDVGRVLHLSKKCDWSMTDQKLQSEQYDSVTFNPGDGVEYVVYSSDRVLSTAQYEP